MSARCSIFKVIILAMLEVSSTESLHLWGSHPAGCGEVPGGASKTTDGNYVPSAKTSFRSGGLEGNNPRQQVAYPEPKTWIEDFCRSPGNEFFAEVPESFIRESMNLIDIGRGVEIPYYKEALAVLLGERSLKTSEGQKASILQSSVTLLYGLLHARFLVSPQGLKVVLEKFSKAEYGRCPRVFCQGQGVLPVGETDLPMQSSVKVFCPRCGDLYSPSDFARVYDGAFWGTTLAHLVLLGWPELKTTPNTNHYVPRVFGFRVLPRVSGGEIEDAVNCGCGERQESKEEMRRFPMRRGASEFGPS